MTGKPQSLSQGDSLSRRPSSSAEVEQSEVPVHRPDEKGPPDGNPMSKSSKSAVLTSGDLEAGMTWNPRYSREQTSSVHPACSGLRPSVILRELRASATSSNVLMAPFMERSVALLSASSSPDSFDSSFAKRVAFATSCAHVKPTPLLGSSSLDHSLMGTASTPS